MSYEAIGIIMFSGMLAAMLTGQRVFGAIGFVSAAAALHVHMLAASISRPADGRNLRTATLVGLQERDMIGPPR